MTNCTRGRELLADLQRSEFLPPWDEEGVKTVCGEINGSLTRMQDMAIEYGEYENYPLPVKVSLHYYLECSLRNRRYLNSYVNHRLNRIRNLRWEAGAVLPEKIQQETLSTKENEFYSAYNELLGEYTEELGVDLLADYEPPKDLYIEIRALESCGEIMTENGPINLEPGATTFVKRSDVAHLILQGKVKHVLADK